MSGTLNRVMLIGNLARDPETRSFQNGGRVCNMTVVTSERWKDKGSGEQKERAEYHRVAVLDDKLIEICEKYVRKGGQIYLSGQLETRKWTDQSGQERYSTEIVLRPYRGEITLLGAPQRDRDASQGQGYRQARDGGSWQAPDRMTQEPPFDDEIRF